MKPRLAPAPRLPTRGGSEFLRWCRPLGLGLALGLVLLAGAGCERLAAQRLATAPNRYPRWLAPGGHTFLNFPDAFITNFPLQTLRVGPPPAQLRYRVVPPADYQVSVTRSNGFAHGKPRDSFHFTGNFPPPTTATTPPPRGVALVLHGYGGDSTLMLPLALRLAQEGWLCVVPDLRGHGQSTGKRITFGVVETQDLSALLAALGAAASNAPVVAVGHSYGAALALRWRAVEPRVRRVVALASYADLTAAGLNIRQEYSPWFPESLSRAAFAGLPALLGVGPPDLDPVTVLQRSPAPALFIVGMEDRITPPLHSSRLRTLAGPGSEVRYIPGANHETVPYFFDPVLTATADWLAEKPSPANAARP